jgi:hypothetical protein
VSGSRWRTRRGGNGDVDKMPWLVGGPYGLRRTVIFFRSAIPQMPSSVPRFKKDSMGEVERTIMTTSVYVCPCVCVCVCVCVC